jgi:PDZ domain-containing protein
VWKRIKLLFLMDEMSECLLTIYWRVRCWRVGLIGLLLFLATFGCDGGEGNGLVVTEGDSSTPVAVELVHGTLFVVTAVVNESINLDMLVDTGSSYTHVPAEIFGNLGGEVYISSLCLENGTCFNNFAAKSSDSAFTQNTAGYFNGIIGLDVLRNFDVTFDYRGESIYFYDTLEAGAIDPVEIPFHYESSRPFADVSIEGALQGDNLLDTGAAYTRITAPMLALLSQEPVVLFDSVVFSLGAPELVEYVALSDYCTGPACPGDIIVQIGSWPAVGGTFFREYLTVFSFTENVVKLHRYDDRSHIKESGLQRMGLQVNIYDASEIIYVIPGGVAWEGGLREGDEIISANNIAIDTLGYFGIYALLADTLIKEYQFRVVTPESHVTDVVITIE